MKWTDPFRDAGFADAPGCALSSWRGGDIRQQLTPDEENRLARLKDPRRQSDLAGSLALRRELFGALAQYDPALIELSADVDGAPLLLRPKGYSISISNKENWTIVALDRAGMRIGVDVENVREINWRAILGMICGDEEREMFAASLSAEKSEQNFFRMWTVKEAILKATGEGFRAGPKHVRVPQSIYGGAARAQVEAFSSTFDVWAVQHGQFALSLARKCV
ncbi:4'-phosphopantetheinyl transferase family protein [Hyphomonas sp.]|uniref:4'-phosphopantetheinyl transferase family protein n=1 Tax=Hyphomonas sp. TaxID=87 RepID=UPI00391BECCD